MSEQLSGIYQIRNLVNGKKYIGQASNLRKRKSNHFSSLKRGDHYNQHFQRAYDKYGKENFVFEILIYCELFELTPYEQFFVNREDRKNLYNICLKCVDSSLGVIRSEEARQKMSISHIGLQSGESSPWYGKHRSKETKEKISNSLTGRLLSDDHKKKLSEALSGENNPMYGVCPSEETRKRMSKSHIGLQSGENHPMWGKHHSKESKEKISKAKRGASLSEETKKKLSEALSGEKSYLSKLLEGQVFEILDMYFNKNEKQVDIARKYGVYQSNIWFICNGKTWKSAFIQFCEENNINISEEE